MPYAINNTNNNNNDNYNRKSRRGGLMPLEPLPWDRKSEFFRERKHGNGYGYDNGHHNHHNNIGGGGGGGGPGGGWRWRDSPSPFAGSRNNPDFSPRWSDFRRPVGHGKQGGWHMYHEDSGHGYSTPRSDRFVDDDSFRPSGPRGDGRYGRMYRENRNVYGQRDWRSHSWENNHHYTGPSSTPGRPHNLNDQRSVGDSPLRPSLPNSDSSGQLQSKDQADKTSDANGIGTSQRVDKENTLGSLDWKPLKWSRTGSLTSRGSGLSHSSSSKSTGGESSDVKGNLPPKCLTPVQSLSGDAAGCAPSDIHVEDTISRKKPRLGWGEGLAKYEKKKVDGPEENVNKAENRASVSNAGPLNSLTSNLVDKSPKITGFSDCSSPATPSSFACSSSPGIEEKTYHNSRKTTDCDANNFSVSSMPVSGSQREGLQFSLEKLELDSITNLSSLLVELLQVDDKCSTDSGFMRSSAFNKLLLWKGDISKTLELTETEIDSLENEMKLFKVNCFQGNPCLALSNPLTADGKDGHSDGRDGFTRPASLEVVSSRNVNVQDTLRCDDARGIPDESKDADIDSPGTATSKLSEPLSPCRWKNSSPANMGFVESNKTTTETLDTSVDGEKIVGTSCQYDDAMVIKDDSGAAVIELRGACNEEAHTICDVIFASNKGTAAKASEVFFKLLPSCDPSADSMGATRLSCLPADPTIREKFLRRKRFLRFKERVLSLQYRAFHRVWKEDLRLLSLRSHRSKLQKKLDLTSRSMQFGNQKHRSSVRSRFASPAKSLSSVSTTEILNFTSKLLSESEVKPYRSSLKMPAMILDEKERMSSSFLSRNGLVEDPCAFEKERALINPWTVEEKEIFMEKLAACGKDFSKIASFLDHKTTADCIEFYYKNHRSECFEKTKKLDGKKQMKPLSSSTYLLTSGKKWSREMNAASLDILGAASVIASQADQVVKTSNLLLGKISNRKSRGADGITVASSSLYVAEDERETAAADVLAGICGSFSSEAMSSCITSSVDPGEGNPDLKRRKVGSSDIRPLTPDVTQNVDDDTCSDESCGEMGSVDWTDDEKSLFVRAFSSHGKDFLMISRFVRTKSRDQCKVFFSKARKCLGLDIIHSGTGSGGVLGSNDTNGGGSDTEDACVMETGSVVCSDKSGSRMNEDLPHVNQDVTKPDSAVIADLNTSEENCGPGPLDFKDADMEPEVSCPRDNLADVSEIDLGGVAVDVQEKKLIEADDLQRREVVVTLDDTLTADSTTSIVEGVSSRVSSRISPHSVSSAVDERSTGKAPIGSGVVQDGQSEQSSGGELHNQQGSISIVKGKSSQDLKDLSLDLPMKAEKDDPNRTIAPESEVQSFQECYFRKCSRSASQNSVAERPFHCKEDRNADAARFSTSSAADKPCSNGDVKLFGKILSKTSSVEKPTSSAQAHDEKVKHHSSAGKFNLKPCVSQEANGNSVLAKHDHNSFIGLENVPIKSYGFWDGTKIQTGFPSVTDSALLLSKYPATLGVSSSKPEQQRLQAPENSNKCNINGACVFSPREFNSSSGSVIDCPVFRNPEGVQPFTLDVEQRLELYPEVQRNGFEPMLNVQAHGRGVVTLNVVQGGVHGGSCSDISDPVAALRMHYSQQYGGSGPAVNGIIREETWKGHGDVGR